MKEVIFFKKKNHSLNTIFPKLGFKKNLKIVNIKSLNKAQKFDLSFFDSLKYKNSAIKTKASYCITNKKLEKFLPKHIKIICVENVLFELAHALKKCIHMLILIIQIYL